MGLALKGRAKNAGNFPIILTFGQPFLGSELNRQNQFRARINSASNSICLSVHRRMALSKKVYQSILALVAAQLFSGCWARSYFIGADSARMDASTNPLASCRFVRETALLNDADQTIGTVIKGAQVNPDVVRERGESFEMVGYLVQGKEGDSSLRYREDTEEVQILRDQDLLSDPSLSETNTVLHLKSGFTYAVLDVLEGGSGADEANFIKIKLDGKLVRPEFEGECDGK
jgi:hypothetical protein